MTDTMSDVMAGAFGREGGCLSGDPYCYRNRRGYAPTLTLCAVCQERADDEYSAIHDGEEDGDADLPA